MHQQFAPKNVAIYIRWSTEEQTEGTTLEVQLERCQLYIRSQGWTAREDLTFVDDGYSGGSLERPALARLRRAIKGGVIDCVVAYSIDRLSRNLADITQLIQSEWAGRCVFRSATQPISTDESNPTGQLVFNILASFAEFERGLIRERTYAGAVKRARQGKAPGGRTPPFGYIRVGVGELAIDSADDQGNLRGNAALVRRMFEMAISGPGGQGPNLIARRLNDEGIPSPRGTRWWAAVVRDILRNPVYAGTVAFGRRKQNPGHKRDKSIPRRQWRETPLALVEDAVPAIVPKEMWERAQELEKARSERYQKRNATQLNCHLLTGLVHCRCGGPLHVFFKEQRKRYYRCSRNAQAGGCPHQPGLYQADELEQAVVGEVMARYGTRELREGALRALEEKLSADRRREEYLCALKQAEQRVKAVEADLVRLRRAARTGEIQLGTYEELKADADGELAELESTRRGLEVALSTVRDNSAALAKRRDTLGQVDAWGALEVFQQRQVLLGLLHRVEVFRHKGTEEPVALALVWEQ